MCPHAEIGALRKSACHQSPSPPPQKIFFTLALLTYEFLAYHNILKKGGGGKILVFQ